MTLLMIKVLFYPFLSYVAKWQARRPIFLSTDKHRQLFGDSRAGLVRPGARAQCIGTRRCEEVK